MTAPADNPEPANDEDTGISGLRWRGVYAIVLAAFVVSVVLLTWFSRAFL